MGYSLAGLAGSNGNPNHVPVAPKYSHPENPAVTWSDRGPKPLWFLEALEAD